MTGTPGKRSDSSRNNGSGSVFENQLPGLKRIFSRAGITGLFIISLLYFSTCIQQVKVQETGVLLRFGRVVRPHVDPGICLKLPWPADRLVTVKTRSVETIQGGFGADPERLEEFENTYGPVDQMSQGTLAVPYIITGDKNILHLKVLVNYRVTEPVTYLYEVDDPPYMLALLIQDVLLNCVSASEVDRLLTSGKIELRDILNRELAEHLKRMDLGVEILSAEIRNVRPPRSTMQAFKDVINAQEESRETIHQAESYAKRTIPEAHADALRIVSEAESYGTKIVESAKGEAGRFELVAVEYQRYPDLTRERLRQEMLEKVMPVVSKRVLGPADRGDLPARLRFLVNSPAEEAGTGLSAGNPAKNTIFPDSAGAAKQVPMNSEDAL